jgi:transcriptional regulator with XRE-family HTH domain
MADRKVDRIKLRDLREREGLSQRSLALAAGISERTVKYAEAGRHSPTGIVLHKLAKALNVEVSELLIEAESNGAAA